MDVKDGAKVLGKANCHEIFRTFWDFYFAGNWRIIVLL